MVREWINDKNMLKFRGSMGEGGLCKIMFAEKLIQLLETLIVFGNTSE